MVLENLSIENQENFIIEFTKRLIKASSKETFFELETIVEKEEEEKQEKIENPLTNKEFTKKIENKFNPFPKLKRIENQELTKISFEKRENLIIPEHRLPTTFQDLRPVPTKVEIDLGKLNPLIKDFMVREMQCNGPDKNIIVKGAMGTKKSNVILNKEEIEMVLDTFSKTARIPISGGVTKIVVGNLLLLAITSQIIESKFLIKKLYPELPGTRRIYER